MLMIPLWTFHTYTTTIVRTLTRTDKLMDLIKRVDTNKFLHDIEAKLQ